MAPVKSVDRTASLLTKAIEDYYLWMVQSGYATQTVYNYHNILKHFQSYIGRRNVFWEDVFIYKTLKAFEKKHPLRFTAEAVRGLSRYLFEHKRISAPVKKPVLPLPDIYEDYLRYCENIRDIHPSTIHRAGKLLAAFNAYLIKNGLGLEQIGIEDIDAFLTDHNAGFKPATCRHNRSNLRDFLRYLYDRRHIIKRDLAPLVVGAPVYAQAKPPKFLRPDEVTELFASLCSQSAKELRTAAMIHLAYTLGLRPVEISLIKLDDICFSQGYIRLPDRKSANPVKLPLPEITVKAVAAYILGARAKSTCRGLFLSLHAPYRPMLAATVGQHVTAALRKINPCATAYWLRHTYAQNLLESGATIFEVKQMLGHDNIQSSRRYVHIHTQLMREVLFDETV
jgi:integrase/recombinase XerD